MPPAISAAELLRRLPDSPRPEDVRSVARTVALAAARTDYPGKSIAQTVRSVKRAGHPTALAELLGVLAREELHAVNEHGNASPAAAPSAPWLTVDQTADMLRKGSRTIREWLADVDGRRQLGWPWYDGATWHIPEPAINPLTRASYLASQPLEEPAAHRATLPPGYRADSAA